MISNFNDPDGVLENIVGKGQIAGNQPYFHPFKGINFTRHLTLYQTIPIFYNPEEKGFGNIVGKKKMLVGTIFVFSHDGFQSFNPLPDDKF